MPQNVFQQLSGLLNAFSAEFRDSTVQLSAQLNVDSGAVPGPARKQSFKELSGFELCSDSSGPLNKLAYRVGSVKNSSLTTFLHNTSISFLKLSSIEHQPLLISVSESESNFDSGNELIYKGDLKLNWIEKDYYFYMSPEPDSAGCPKESSVHVESLKLNLQPHNHNPLLDGDDANEALASEQVMRFELSGVLDQPINGLFKFINITAISKTPLGCESLAQLPLTNIEMVIG